MIFHSICSMRSLTDLLSIVVLFVKHRSVSSSRLTVKLRSSDALLFKFSFILLFLSIVALLYVLTLDMDPLQLVFFGFTTTKIESLCGSKGSVTSNNMMNEKYCVTKIRDQDQRSCSVQCSVNVILVKKINHISAQIMKKI